MTEANADIFINVLDATLVALIALFFGWIGSAARSYFSEKGKNLATKQDISNITQRIEDIKYENQKNFYKSSNLINRQIKSFDIIANEIAELQIYCLRKIFEEQGNEHAVPYDDLVYKSSFQRSVHIFEIAHKQRVFISQGIFDQIMNLCQRLFMLGHAERLTDTLGPVGPDHYAGINSAAKDIMASMQNEVFSTKET